jgi:hypothetical protein
LATYRRSQRTRHDATAREHRYSRARQRLCRGALASDKASLEAVIRTADVDVRLLIVAFGV